MFLKANYKFYKIVIRNKILYLNFRIIEILTIYFLI